MAKYKKPLKSCDDCKYKNFIIDSNGEKVYYCKIYSNFINQCPNKRK